MNWAIMIFLGVAAIVFLGQAVFLGRNHARWRGLLPGVTAAGLGVAALVHIRPALFNTDAETLRAQLDLRESQISSLRTDKDKLTSDVQAGAVQLERAERTHARAIADFTSDVVEVRRRLATRPEGFVIDEP